VLKKNIVGVQIRKARKETKIAQMKLVAQVTVDGFENGENGDSQS